MQKVACASRRSALWTRAPMIFFLNFFAKFRDNFRKFFLKSFNLEAYKEFWLPLHIHMGTKQKQTFWRETRTESFSLYGCFRRNFLKKVYMPTVLVKTDALFLKLCNINQEFVAFSFRRTCASALNVSCSNRWLFLIP